MGWGITRRVPPDKEESEIKINKSKNKITKQITWKDKPTEKESRNWSNCSTRLVSPKEWSERIEEETDNVERAGREQKSRSHDDAGARMVRAQECRKTESQKQYVHARGSGRILADRPERADSLGAATTIKSAVKGWHNLRDTSGCTLTDPRTRSSRILVGRPVRANKNS